MPKSPTPPPSFHFTPPGASFVGFSAPAFDGMVRTCKRYSRHGRVMRCAKFRKGKGTPPCGGIAKKNLRVGRGPSGGHGCRK